MLREHGIGSIYLVTQAYHMPRSVNAFEKQGLTVIPAPTYYYSRGKQYFPNLLLPSAYALQLTRIALHEWVGRVVYYFFS